jgi:hypothetical protein
MAKKTEAKDETKRPIGRPRLDPSSTGEGPVFRLRMRDAEKAQLEGLAAALDCSESEVMRRALAVFAGLPAKLQAGTGAA